MYKETYSKMIESFKDNNVYIAESTSKESNNCSYFIYNDNQTNGYTTEKICQI